MNKAWRIVLSIFFIGWAFIGFIQSGAIGQWTDRLMNLIFGVRRDFMYVLIVLLLIDTTFLPKKWSLKFRQKITLTINVVLLYLVRNYLIYGIHLLGICFLMEEMR